LKRLTCSFHLCCSSFTLTDSRTRTINTTLVPQLGIVGDEVPYCVCHPAVSHLHGLTRIPTNRRIVSDTNFRKCQLASDFVRWPTLFFESGEDASMCGHQFLFMYLNDQNGSGYHVLGATIPRCDLSFHGPTSRI